MGEVHKEDKMVAIVTTVIAPAIAAKEGVYYTLTPCHATDRWYIDKHHKQQEEDEENMLVEILF